jgi:(4-(4-[2-(gamma-L-glutamylamino)ethyl]phenoxymethyl)furan-2-yl)methanamine synthase
MIAGWDIGGAHLKCAVLDLAGRLGGVWEVPCRLWEGLDRLEEALATLPTRLGQDTHRHALTMTGELADCFRDREEGVRALVSYMVRRLGGHRILVYAGRRGFMGAARAGDHALDVASANWHASAAFSAWKAERGVLIDIGSTTTDLVRFGGGRVQYQGYTDGERLRSEELVYTGVLRTPIMAVANRVPFAGEWQRLAAEHFATMADVYGLLGQLEERGRETRDGAGTAPEDSARRIARMLGRDLAAAPMRAWQALAAYLARAQVATLREALERVLSRDPEGPVPFIGAGIGRFLVRELARQLDHPYVDFSAFLEGPDPLREMGARCAPAAALAYLVKACPTPE